MALPVLDETVAMGFRSAAGGWNTSIVPGGGGTEYRNQVWLLPRRRYEFDFPEKNEADVRAIMEFVDDRRGALLAWLFKDWLNYQLTDELILTAAGGETTAQVKQIVGTGNVFSRDIKYIKSGTLVVEKNGTPLTVTTEYTINDSGLITFITPLSAADAITVTCEFYIKVRFEMDMLAPSIEHVGSARIDGVSAIEVR